VNFKWNIGLVKFQHIILLLFVLLIMACTPREVVSPVANVFPVQWFPGFAMSGLLANPFPVRNQNDVQALLDKPWYSSFKFVHVQKREVFSMDRCNQILPEIAQLETYQPYDRSYLYLATMCVATESIAKAHPSQYSALSGFTLDEDAPWHLPKDLRFPVSDLGGKTVPNNEEIVSWAAVDSVTFTSQDGPYQARYVLENAFQEISLIARGDFNHDDIEDILLLAQSNIADIPYTAYRLFWVTKVDENSPITLIRKYSIAY